MQYDKTQNEDFSNTLYHITYNFAHLIIIHNVCKNKRLKENNLKALYLWTKGRYCGTPHPDAMVLSSNHVIVSFITDDSTQDTGFLLHWSATNGIYHYSIEIYIVL